jgi:ribosomal protein S12 methylthiotransferase accessory factor
VAGRLLIALPLFYAPANSTPMITNPIERSFSLEVAEAALIRTLDDLGYQYDFKIAGDIIHTAKCVITDKKTGNFLASGNGKGELTASRVGSLFEATEHLFSHYQFIDPEKVSYINTLDFSRDNRMCDTLPLVILKDGEDTSIPFLEYTAVNGVQNSFYPLALACPGYIDLVVEYEDLRKKDTFNYGRLEQYSSNSGTAIGMNTEEALIHGLLESIERTSLSKFLTNTFLLNKEKHLRVVDSLTLPHHITDVLGRIEKELGSKIFIFEMPNKFGIPAYCSWMEQYEFKIGIAGYGCSLSTEHAILRCLYELAQYYLLSKHIFGFDWLRSISAGTSAQLEGLPLHRDCAQFDVGLKCKTLGYELVSYNDLPKLQFSRDPKEYLNQLTDIIYSNGEIPFATELKTIGDGIKITHTFITGEDRFFNVKNGKSTFPATL